MLKIGTTLTSPGQQHAMLRPETGKANETGGARPVNKLSGLHGTVLNR